MMTRKKALTGSPTLVEQAGKLDDLPVHKPEETLAVSSPQSGSGLTSGWKITIFLWASSMLFLGVYELLTLFLRLFFN